MKKILLTLLLFWSVVLAQHNAHITAPQGVQEISAKSLFELIQKDVDDLHLLDIREPDQIGHGEIFHLNLVKITRGYLEFKVEKAFPDKKARIIVYCCTGKRGKLATKTLKDMGYTNVYSLQGGIRGWVDAGYPLDTVYGEVLLKSTLK